MTLKDYVLKNYPTRFIKKVVHRDARGKITKTETIELPVIIEEFDSHYTVKNNKDASPIILSKGVV